MAGRPAAQARMAGEALSWSCCVPAAPQEVLLGGMGCSPGGDVANEVRFNLPVQASADINAAAHQLPLHQEVEGRGPIGVKATD